MIISVTGLFAAVGLTFAMSQALTMQPNRLGEGEVKEMFRIRFRPHSESEPRLKIRKGSQEGRILVKAWIEPKITEDRNRLGLTLRNFLWGASYKSGRPEKVTVVFRDPVTGKSQEREMFPLAGRRYRGRSVQQGHPLPGASGGQKKMPPARPGPSALPSKTQSVPKGRKGRGFKSQSSSSKTR